MIAHSSNTKLSPWLSSGYQLQRLFSAGWFQIWGLCEALCMNVQLFGKVRSSFFDEKRGTEHSIGANWKEIVLSFGVKWREYCYLAMFSIVCSSVRSSSSKSSRRRRNAAKPFICRAKFAGFFVCRTGAHFATFETSGEHVEHDVSSLFLHKSMCIVLAFNEVICSACFRSISLRFELVLEREHSIAHGSSR